MNKTGIVIILLCFLAAAAVVLWERRKTRKTMEEIERMLDAQKYIKTIYGIGYSWVTKDE